MDSKPSRFCRARPFILLFGSLVIPGCGLFGLWVITDPYQWFACRGCYEEIVRRIGDSRLSPGEKRDFLISGDRDPSTLRPLREGELLSFQKWDLYELHRGGRVIHARRAEDGRLVVRITVLSRPHAGTYGLVYSSGNPEEADLTQAFGSDGRSRHLADHWWAVEDRSD